MVKKMGFTSYLRHKGNHKTKFEIFRKVMKMLVVHEDLKQKRKAFNIFSYL